MTPTTCTLSEPRCLGARTLPKPKETLTRSGSRSTSTMGRGGSAHHHPATEEDHPNHEGAGLQEALPDPDRDRRLRGSAGAPPPHRRRGPGHTLHPRSPHADLDLGLLQKLRLISAAVRVNMQFMCVWRLRNQLELEAVLEELTALLPKQELQAIKKRRGSPSASSWCR